MMTAIKRKQELREKVDVNFDGRVSFLEYLLYQYKDVANPADFCKRSMAGGDEHPEIRKARLALEEANKAIKAYEEEKARLEEGSKEPGVKGLKFKNMLAQLDASPLWEAINKALITAEAAVRIAVKKFGKAGGGGGGGGSDEQGNSEGALWWMQTELAEKKVSCTLSSSRCLVLLTLSHHSTVEVRTACEINAHTAQETVKPKTPRMGRNRERQQKTVFNF
jgi:hypothetical protein